MEFPRQEDRSGLPFPAPGDLPDPGIKSASLASTALAGRFFHTSTTWKAPIDCMMLCKCLDPQEAKKPWRTNIQDETIPQLLTKLLLDIWFHSWIIEEKEFNSIRTKPFKKETIIILKLSGIIPFFPRVPSLTKIFSDFQQFNLSFQALRYLKSSFELVVPIM